MLNVAQKGDRLSRTVDLCIVMLIVLSILSCILESVQSLHQRYATFFRYWERFTLILFSFEYLLRLWSCKEEECYAVRWGRVYWALSFLALVDLFSIFPGLLIISGLDLRFLRAIRLLRLFRLSRYNRNFLLILQVLRSTKEALTISLTGILILLLVVSSLIYTVEHQFNPEGFGSIPATMWWGVITLTTVGYGDVYPITTLGKVLASIVALLGIGTFAIPAGILAGAFNRALVNVAPSLDVKLVANFHPISQNQRDNPGTLVSYLVAGAVVDKNVEHLLGIAITHLDRENGDWEYFEPEKENWQCIEHVSEVSSLLLPADERIALRFLPRENFSGRASMHFRAWDQSTGIAFGTDNSSFHGGSSAFSSQQATVSITVYSRSNSA